MQELFEAIDSGAAVLTSTTRLARALTIHDETRRVRGGGCLWRTPTIIPYAAWLNAAWIQQEPNPSAILLNSWQEQFLWRQVILESESGADLLAVTKTARAAASAWRLAHAWRLPLTTAGFEQLEDAAAFLEWSRRYTAVCERNNWTDTARLPDRLSGLVRDGQMSVPRTWVLAGFPEWEPQQRDLLEMMQNTGARITQYEPEPIAARSFRHAAADSRHELRAAAEWCRQILERQPEARIAVVASDLYPLRDRLEQAFLEILHPEGVMDPRPTAGRAFHLALGRELARHPVFHTALLILRLAEGRLPLARMGSLLRSPFVGGAFEERNARALLDAHLRRDHPVTITAARLDDGARRDAPILSRILARWERARRGANNSLPSSWSLRFSRMLAAFQWPGTESLTSSEFQAVEAGRELLSEFASLDSVTGALTLEDALEALEEMAGLQLFQEENQNQPVQILSLSESRGLTFDYVWMLGLNDEAWPPPPAPHPFLPPLLQRQQNVPHSSAERERADASRDIAHLRRSARQIVFSYAEAEEDRLLRPSPLIAGLPPHPDVEPQSWLAWYPSQTLERLVDSVAPPVEPGTRVPGGVRVLQLQSACPFRAFAEIRLGARPLEQGENGYNPRDRGTFVHRALETIWRNLETHKRLLEIPAQDLEELVRAATRGLFPQSADPFARELASIEQDRINALVLEWLAVERQRAPFRVLSREEKRTISAGGLEFDARLDRVDQLDDGTHVLIDYKTGACDPRAWDGDRPDEPQLPVYCVSHSHPVTALALASVVRNEPGFEGVAARANVLPGVAIESLAKRIGEWRRVVERLAGEFAVGDAGVHPKNPPETCRFCRLYALCRISETGLVRDDDSDTGSGSGAME